MSLGLVGKKQGMSRFFTEEGSAYPVTVISIEPNTITQIKTVEIDGYNSIQVTTGSKKEKKVNKAINGHFNKASVPPGEGLWEFAIDEEDLEKIKIGQSISLEVLKEGQKVDVSGTSKGKGFAGTVKRWNFKMQDATHGNSLSHRAPGSIGQCQTPGRVWKGKKMSGHMGDETVTVQNLKIISLDLENNLILVKGSVPGHTGSRIFLKPSKGEMLELIQEETQLEETQPEETQPEETQPEETQLEETQPEETQPEEDQAKETKGTKE